MRPVFVVDSITTMVGCLALGGTRVRHLSRRGCVIAHAPNVAGEQEPPALTVRAERYFGHAGSKNVRRERNGRRDPKRVERLGPRGLACVLRFLETIEPQSRIAL